MTRVGEAGRACRHGGSARVSFVYACAALTNHRWGYLGRFVSASTVTCGASRNTVSAARDHGRTVPDESRGTA